MIKAGDRNNGFSLIEALAAAVLLGGAVVVLCGLSARSLAAVKLNREYERAWDLLDRQLLLIDKVGVESFLEEGRNSGQINDAASGRQWRWRADVESLDITGVYEITLRIEWDCGGGRVRSVTGQTRLGSRQEAM